MGTSGVSLDKEEIIKALHKKRGVIEHAAAFMGCDPSAIYLWRKKDPDVANAIKEAREARIEQDADDNLVLLDMARKSARVRLQEYDTTATIFILKALGGFTEGNNSQTFNISVVDKPYTQECVND